MSVDPKVMSAAESADQVSTIINALISNAKRLGLIWNLRPATIATPTHGIYDGDSTAVRMISLIGKRTAGERVLCAAVPPSGNYILGMLGDNWVYGGKLTLKPTPSSASQALIFNEGYSIYVDNAGAGSDNSRLWIDGPDDGEVVIGPRAGAATFASIRLRTGATTASAANCFIDSATQQIRRSTSSRRYKDNIEDARVDLTAVRQLRPVQFHDKTELKEKGVEAKVHVGLIAEEVSELGLREFVYYDENGEPDSVQYDRIVVGLLGVIKELEDRVTDLEQRTAVR